MPKINKCVSNSGLSQAEQNWCIDQINKKLKASKAVDEGFTIGKEITSEAQNAIKPFLVEQIDHLITKADLIRKQVKQKKSPPVSKSVASEVTPEQSKSKTAPMDTPVGMTMVRDGKSMEFRSFVYPRLIESGKNKGKYQIRLTRGRDKKTGEIILGKTKYIDKLPSDMRFQPEDIDTPDGTITETLDYAKKEHGVDLRVVKARSVETELAEQMLNAFGRNVVWYTGKGRIPNGFVMPGDKRTIYLNVNGRNMMISVAGHELIHSIRNSSPELYRWFDNIIRSDVINFQKYVDQHNAKLAASNQPTLSNSAAYEELYGDFIGEVMLDPVFWQSMHELNPGMAKKFLNRLLKIFNAMLRLLEVRDVPDAKPYFQDTKRAQEAVKFLLSSEYKRQQQDFGSSRDVNPFLKDGKITNALRLFYGAPDGVPRNLLELVMAAGGKVGSISEMLQMQGYHPYVADRTQAMAEDAENHPFPSPELTASRIIEMHKRHPEHREWYRKQSYLFKIIKNTDDREVFRWLAILSHTSRNKDPVSNITEFIKVLLAHKSNGKLPITLAGQRIDDVLNADSIRDMFNLKIEGVNVPFVSGETKVKAFADAFAVALRDKKFLGVMQSVIDVWVSRYFYPMLGREDWTQQPLKGKQQSRIQEHMRKVEKILIASSGEHWDADNAQATLWFWIKDQYKHHQPKEVVGYTFDQAIEIKAGRLFGLPRDESIEPRYVNAFINQNLKDASSRTILDHYSQADDLLITDPEYQGAGRPGAEQQREVVGPNVTYFFFRNDDPEKQFERDRKYRAVINGNLYDLGKDVDGLKGKYDITKMGQHDSYKLKAMEEKIIENGYSGFFETRSGQKVAVIFEPVKVHRLQTYHLASSPRFPREKMLITERHESDKLALEEVRKIYNLSKSQKNTRQVSEIYETSIRSVLDHPLIDFVSYKPGEGRWRGRREFSPEVVVSGGDIAIIKGKFAEILKKYRQDSGLLSMPYEPTRYGNRPAEIPASQARSYIITSGEIMSSRKLSTVSRILSEHGLGTYNYIPELAQIVIHHVNQYDGFSKAQFEGAVSQALNRIQAHFSRSRFEVGRMWFKHDVLSNDWKRVNKNEKGEVTLDGRKGEFYDRIIKTGNKRTQDLALSYSPPVITGKNESGIPVLAGKPNKPQDVPRNENQIETDYKYIDDTTKARWARQRSIFDADPSMNTTAIHGIKMQVSSIDRKISFQPIDPEFSQTMDEPHDLSRTYKKYSDAPRDNKNVLIRPDNKKGKQLLVQISSGGDRFSREAINTKEGLADKYYDNLYSKGDGYARPDDFWEIPEWVGMATKNFPDSDFYVVRNSEEAKNFLNKEQYETVMFSVMDENKIIIDDIIAEYDGEVIVSGYVRKDYFASRKNATWVNTMEEATVKLGVPYRVGIDLKHFGGTKTVPRLELSRGCLHNCAFCLIPSKIEESSDKFIDEQIKAFEDLEFELVYLNDKTFGQAKNYTRLTDINEKLKKANPKFKGFIIQTTAGAFNKIDNDFLINSGITHVELGMESYNDDILKRINKPHNTKMIDQAVEKIRKLNMKFIPNIIVGLAGVENGHIWTENKQTYKNTMNFLEANSDIASHVNVYVLATYEGSKLAGQIGIQSQEDQDQNTLQKSWLKGQDSHEQFYSDVLGYGNRQLDARADVKFQPTSQAQTLYNVAGKVGRAIDAAEDSIRGVTDIERSMADKIDYAKGGIFDRIKDATASYLTKQGREKLYTQLFDRLRPLKQLGHKAYVLARGETGTQAIMSMILEHGPARIDSSGAFTVDTRGEGFLPFIQSVGKDWKPFLYWMAAKRSTELDLEGRENWLSDTDRAKIFRETAPEDDAKFEEYAKKMDGFQENILDIGVKSGLINEGRRREWEHAYYVPFYRILEDDGTRERYLAAPKKSKLRTDAGIRQLIGAEEKIGDLQGNLFKNWFHIIHESQRNLTRLEAAKFAREQGGLESVFEPIQKIQGKSLFFVMRPDENGKMQREFIPRKDFANILTYRENGDPEHILVHDPDLFEALTDMSKKNLDGTVMKMFRTAKRWLTIGATIGPAFRMANALRDTMHTALVNKSFIPFTDTWRGFMKSMREDDDYIKFMASGFGFGSSYVQADDPDATNKFINKIVKREGEGARGRILDTPRKLYAFWEKIGSASENAARVQLYTKLRAQGIENLQAGFEGRDLLDFTLTGQAGAVRALTQMVPFLNARIQGLYKLGRTYSDKELRKNIMLRGTIMVAASVALFGFADDDEWDKLESWDKWAYYHFWIGKEHFRMPKPFEMGAIFSSFPVALMETLKGDEDGKYMWEFIKDTFIDTFRIDVPQLVKPPMEMWSNKSFFTGRQLVPDYLSDLPDEEQFKQGTSETARMVGAALNISPIKVEHLAGAYFAVLGQTVLDGTDMILHNTLDYPENPSLTIRDYPLLGRFIRGKKPEYIRQLSWYYDTLSDIDGIFKTVNNYRRDGEIETAEKIKEKNKAMLRHRPKFLNAKKRLSVIRNQIKKTFNSKTMSRAQKRKVIDRLTAKRNRIVTDLHRKIE